MRAYFRVSALRGNHAVSEQSDKQREELWLYLRALADGSKELDEAS